MSSHTTFRMITPQRRTPGWFRRWLLAPPPGPTIGRKRRARRARGRWIEAGRALGRGHWFRVPLDPSHPGPLELAQKIRVPVDEVDSFLDPSLGEPW